MKVPFTDLRAMHEEVREEIEARWRTLVDGSAFVGGPAVHEFEEAFAKYCEVPYAVGVGSGTDALRIALQAVGVRPGDLVLTVPHTFIATVEAITQAGASPVFIDVEPGIYTMDPHRAAAYLEGQCVRRDGALVERKSGDPAGPPVRPAGRPEAARGDRREARHPAHRGRRPGPLGDLPGEVGRRVRSGRRIQLLPGEEPRGDGRGWGDHDSRCGCRSAL